MLLACAHPRSLLRVILLMAATAVSGQVTTRDDPVGRLLNEWYRDGTAAGLAALTYENRDGQHSPLNGALYPQLQVFKHSAATGPDKGPAGRLRLGPVVGNCSMAAPAVSGGSLPRFYMMDPAGGKFLLLQYLANNLFVYPEHQDHDPGANGIGGYGDLFPGNTPALIISQGSSGSDQPFLKAVLSTIAAFPRETQRVLLERRFLMPTVQAILRQSSRAVKRPEDYLTGAAHPVVFDAGLLDEEKMVRQAQAMTPDRIPPLALAEVLEESEPEPGKHVFEVPKPHPHKLADARVSVCRVFRGALEEYGMVIDFSKSTDLMQRPLKMSVELLQGDPRRVRIDHSISGMTARLRVRWQPPTITGTGRRSHRVDIGVFASNGVSLSAPAILSFYMLPNEQRFYREDGRLAEIDYRAPNPDLGLPTLDTDPRWLKVMHAAARAGDGLRSRLMEKLFTEEQRRSILTAWMPLDERLRSIQAQDAKPGKNEAPAASRAAWEKDLAQVLAQPLLPSGKRTLRQALTSAFNQLADFSELYLTLRPEIDRLAAQSPRAAAREHVQREVRRLLELGVLWEQAEGTLVTASPPDALSAADRHYLRGLNLMVLSQAVFPEALERSPDPAFVDLRLTTPKPWRDVYRYDEASGRLLGWIRHQAGRTAAFDAEGRLLPEGFKNPAKAVPVTYERNAQGLLEWR